MPAMLLVTDSQADVQVAVQHRRTEDESSSGTIQASLIHQKAYYRLGIRG